jgi:hypothetical protein
MPASDKTPIILPTSAPKQKRFRLLSIITIAASCCFFTCAGCCFLTVLFFRPQEVDTPAGAIDVAARITDWTLPDNFVGKSGVTLDNMILRIEIARFSQQQGRGSLIVAQAHSKLMPFSGQRQQLQDLVEKFVPELKKVDLKQPGSRTMSIRTKPAEFEIGTGEDRASTTRYRQVMGHFRGKGDEAVLILQCEEESITEEAIDEFLNSIK